jgi:hypothetical protein
MQPGFFDQEDRLTKLEKLGDPLPSLDSIVDWAAFRLYYSRSFIKSSARAMPDASRTTSR